MKLKTLRRSVILLSSILLLLVCAALALFLRPETDAPQDTQSVPPGGWQELEGKKYYYDPQTGLPVTGWLTQPEGKYFLDDTGSPVIGLFPCPQGSYWFDTDGRMVTGWADTPEGKRYFAEDGTMTVGFLDIDGKRLCFNREGILCVGWQELEGSRYYFLDTGELATGWLKLEEGTWYLQEDGQPYTGWMQSDRTRRYFLPDGRMATGLVQVDGIQRYFTSDGNYVPLVNPWNKVPGDYEAQLVTVEGLQVDATCAEALEGLLKGARDAGLTCVLNSTYRDMATQTYLWNRRYNDYLSQGYSQEEAYRLSARRVAYPGTSEHHTGLAVDIKGSDALYRWFREHGWEYGFHVRYRGDKEALTGIKDEPWHLRYLGKELAQTLYEKDLCLEEYLNSLT